MGGQTMSLKHKGVQGRAKGGERSTRFRIGMYGLTFFLTSGNLGFVTIAGLSRRIDRSIFYQMKIGIRGLPAGLSETTAQ